MANKNLQAAKVAKKDEFYTQLTDIEKELRHYKAHFHGKTVICNCDDPRVSNFYKYFKMQFEHLGLKRLICTCYKHRDVDLFSDHNSEQAVYIDYVGAEENILPLKGDGDFRSQECVELLKQADIVVTNPPFSLFREYVAQLMKYEKKFLIIGNINNVTYKEIFPLIKDNIIWQGYNDGLFRFIVPDDYEKDNIKEIDGQKIASFGNICWYTNLEIEKRNEELIMYKMYNELEFPTYDNYAAIHIPKVSDIPDNYYGVMAVPITFTLDYNPNQFEILGITDRGNEWGLKTKEYRKSEHYNASDLNRRSVLKIGETYKMQFPRILIRRKQ